MNEQNIPEPSSLPESTQKERDTLIAGETIYPDPLMFAAKLPMYITFGSLCGLFGGSMLSAATVTSIKRIITPSLEGTINALKEGIFLPKPSRKEPVSETLDKRMNNLYFDEPFVAFLPVGMLAGAVTAIYGLTQPETRPFSFMWLVTNAVSAIAETAYHLGVRSKPNNPSTSIQA